jgi:hypothetical protein
LMACEDRDWSDALSLRAARTSLAVIFEPFVVSSVIVYLLGPTIHETPPEGQPDRKE